jgi:Cu/Ag efflux pump CusA
VAGVDGVVDPKIEANAVEPVVEVETRLADAARYGIKPGDVRRAEASLLQGITVGSIFGAQKVFDVTVQGVASTRENVGSIRNLLLDTANGGHVRLGKVADVRVVNAPSVIRRDAVARRIDIEADISGRSLDAITADVEDRLAALDLPLEYHAEVVAESAGQEAATQAAVGFAIAAVLAMLLLFQAAFRSWRAAGLAFAAVPLALVGGLLAAVLDGGTLSLGSLLGLLAVLSSRRRACSSSSRASRSSSAGMRRAAPRWCAWRPATGSRRSSGPRRRPASSCSRSRCSAAGRGWRSSTRWPS